MTNLQRLPSKLAAVLYADAAGHSRLTAHDEDATHRRLREYLGATPRIVPVTFDGGIKDLPRHSRNGELIAFHWDGPDRDNVDIYVRGVSRDAMAIRLTQ